ncbi:Acyl-CoA oxidase/dehydrogenase, central domain protein [Cordyceps fumosorosea ARSEF 2679]|uniref:Acyl-CoA oxidase/dehydrogenase, central domain protein n=1 Tax=Cordyceps fumosorosea (strain ARSEF 2679) TaxID=1081104 RepID=A0A167ZEB1_CORFA|nr:Acyl-CoA oxidase/dehydrogenase, central domain protein [Cordyceps fumosorosea ARSEF 2679]OAA67408.1 Acyl-CoA oxidase/dehydrogenase, central domain protein [Cordyceps fumosorosea ARSEF 2679]
MRQVIGIADTAALTTLIIHWNLCMGTIASYSADRPDLMLILEELQSFDAVGEFMLTEVGHGLDARSLETTATQLQDGSFDLHTLKVTAANAMPPATPYSSMPRIAVVFARLVVGGEQRGIQPCVVRLHDATTMAPGITSRLLLSRPGAKVVDHTVTTFTHVRLDASASSAAALTLRKTSAGGSWTTSTASPSAPCPCPSFTSRDFASAPTCWVDTASGALTCASVFDAFATATIAEFMEASSQQVRSALATIFKQTVTHTTKPLYTEMVERCGWQGLYNHNQLQELALAVQGTSIAEGDILVLCIRLASEVLLGRYNLPEAKDPTSLLAQHELGICEEARQLAMAAMTSQGSNRNEEFNTMILPRVRKLVLATGQRAAYEAAVASGTMMPAMLGLYEASCILEDPSWYVKKAGLASADVYRRHAEAVHELLPSLDALLQNTGGESWATAPILEEASWLDFIQRLPTFRSEDKTNAQGKRAAGQGEIKWRL